MIDVRAGSSKNSLRISLGTWRRLRSKIHPTRSHLTPWISLFYSFDSAVNSLLASLQRESHAHQLHSVVVPPPIFVLGFWRSGTTFLHELLSCDERFGYPSTYACLNSSHFLLSERWLRGSANQPRRRPMDDLHYSWKSPQEDEFALLAQGAPSPYEALLVPSSMQNVRKLLDTSALTAEERDCWISVFLYFLKLLTLQQGKPMVLKSPPHGYRLAILKDLFPDARFVIIERNPYEVFASNLKLWRTLLGKYGLEDCPDNEIERFILEAYVLHEQAIAKAIRNDPPKFLARVRYEKLEAEPLVELERLYRDLRLNDFSSVYPEINSYLKKVAGHARNRFGMSHDQKDLVDTKWGCFIEEKQYKWCSDYIDLHSPRHSDQAIACEGNQISKAEKEVHFPAQ